MTTHLEDRFEHHSEKPENASAQVETTDEVFEEVERFDPAAERDVFTEWDQMDLPVGLHAIGVAAHGHDGIEIALVDRVLVGAEYQ